jgi:hypothetical protein
MSDETSNLEKAEMAGSGMSLPPHLRRGGFSETVARRGLGTTGRDQTPTAVRKAEAGSLAHCFICHKQRPS